MGEIMAAHSLVTLGVENPWDWRRQASHVRSILLVSNVISVRWISQTRAGYRFRNRALDALSVTRKFAVT